MREEDKEGDEEEEEEEERFLQHGNANRQRWGAQHAVFTERLT